MRGIALGRQLRPEFVERLLRADPGLQNSFGAAQTYDAVILAALAAEAARSDYPGRLAAQLVGVSAEGELCETYKRCLERVQRSMGSDYEGVSSSTTLDKAGDLSSAEFDTVEVASNGSLTRVGEIGVNSNSPGTPDVRFNALSGPTGNGVLNIALMISTAPQYSDLTRAARAGAKAAIDEINEYIPPIGAQISLSEVDTADGSPQAVTAATNQLINDGVDVVIGGVSGTVDAVAIPPLIQAGLVVIGTLHADRPSQPIVDLGRYFQLTAAPAMRSQAVAQLMTTDGYTRIAVMSSADPTSSASAAETTFDLTLRGATLVPSAIFNPASGSDGANLLVAQIVSSQAQAVLITCPPDQAAVIAKAFIAAGKTPLTFGMYGTSANMTTEFFEAVGEGS